MFFFCKQKTSYDMRISDWISDVCSSDLSARSLHCACRHRRTDVRSRTGQGKKGMTMYDAAGRKQHVPDILDCLAQLSNDEVPTPPKLARAMLDPLPAEVWSNPDYRWLDPCCKSGAILREIAARLLAGLEAWEPDFGNRREHIFRNMLFGTSVTE